MCWRALPPSSAPCVVARNSHPTSRLPPPPNTHTTTQHRKGPEWRHFEHLLTGRELRDAKGGAVGVVLQRVSWMRRGARALVVLPLRRASYCMLYLLFFPQHYMLCRLQSTPPITSHKLTAVAPPPTSPPFQKRTHAHTPNRLTRSPRRPAARSAPPPPAAATSSRGAPPTASGATPRGCRRGARGAAAAAAAAAARAAARTAAS